MAQFKPPVPFNVAMVLLIPTYTTVKGVKTKTYPAITDGIQFNGSFKTYGGTELNVNGVYSVENTASIVTWYIPDVKSDCKIVVLQTGAEYEIVGDPENIDLRNQYLSIKAKRIKGGA